VEQVELILAVEAAVLLGNIKVVKLTVVLEL
jgi:hypothetical protein